MKELLNETFFLKSDPDMTLFWIQEGLLRKLEESGHLALHLPSVTVTSSIASIILPAEIWVTFVSEKLLEKRYHTKSGMVLTS